MGEARPRVRGEKYLSNTGCCDGGNMTVADGGENGGGEEHGLDEVPALSEGEVLIFNTNTCSQL